jgi:hypothetical protein
LEYRQTGQSQQRKENRKEHPNRHRVRKPMVITMPTTVLTMRTVCTLLDLTVSCFACRVSHNYLFAVIVVNS